MSRNLVLIAIAFFASGLVASADQPADAHPVEPLFLSLSCDQETAQIASLEAPSDALAAETFRLLGECGGPEHQACWTSCELAAFACYGSCSQPVCYFHCRQQDIACGDGCDIQYGCF